MKITDLTLAAPKVREGQPTSLTSNNYFQWGKVSYRTRLSRYQFDAFTGSYIDFPGHIKNTDDGSDPANYPLEKLYRVDASLVRIKNVNLKGHGVTADDLKAACPRPKGGAMVINAFPGFKRRWIDDRLVYLTLDAVDWIVDSGIHLLISDIYENKNLDGVFHNLFQAGIACVCDPYDLVKLQKPRLKVTVLFQKFSGPKQIPCRVVAEEPGK